jgi:hypothetical protein
MSAVFPSPYCTCLVHKKKADGFLISTNMRTMQGMVLLNKPTTFLVQKYKEIARQEKVDM